MFLYWQGYEIDGSDTDFDIVLPEMREVQAFVECFLSIPLFDRERVRYHYWDASKKERIVLSRAQVMEILPRGNRPAINIDVNCHVMDALPESVCRQLYELSEGREPHEEAFGKVCNPCMAPNQQENFDRGNLTVSLCVHKAGTKERWYTAEDAQHPQHPEAADGI